MASKAENKPGNATIDPGEAAHFGALAADWWDPRGSSAMLHKLNPVRLAYLRGAIDLHWPGEARGFRPLAGKRALDVGCGAGLLAEPLARLGAEVTAIDAAPENIAVAREHAQAQGLSIDYRALAVEALSDTGHDLVTCMEVIEHVADPALFAAGLARAMAPGGMLVMSTPNRTALSKLMMITLGEGVKAIPRGTHDWSKFMTPDELETLLAGAGLKITDVSGLAFDPRKGFHLSATTSLNYLVTAERV